MFASHDLDELIKNNPHPEFIHFVLPGAIVSGQVVRRTPETIHLENVTTFTGGSSVEIDLLQVPLDRILAWGEGEINLA